MTNVNETVLDVNGLTKTYRGLNKPAVDNLSLQLRRGEIFGFVGPNGAGKTTTLKMLLNLAVPDSGGGTIFGHDIIRRSVAVRRITGFMSGEVRLWEGMRGRELQRFIASLHSGADDTVLEDLNRRFEVPLNRKVKTFSAGQKQQLALMAALGHNPQLLVLDEPTKGLDPTKKAQFLALIARRRDEGATVIISSHVLSEIESICTRVGFIREGVLLGDEEIEAARLRLGSLIIASFDESVDEGALALPGVDEVRRRGGEFVLHLTGDGRSVLKRLADLPLRAMRFRAATLDDLYEGIYLDAEDSQ